MKSNSQHIQFRNVLEMINDHNDHLVLSGSHDLDFTIELPDIHARVLHDTAWLGVIAPTSLHHIGTKRCCWSSAVQLPGIRDISISGLQVLMESLLHLKSART